MLGGSAVYFSLAAARYAPVHVNGIVGSDTAGEYRRILADPNIDLDGLVVSEIADLSMARGARLRALGHLPRVLGARLRPGVGAGADRARRAAPRCFFVGSMDPTPAASGDRSIRAQR